MAVRKNPDGSMTVGILKDEKAEKPKEAAVDTVKAEKPQTKRQPRKSK